MRFELILLLITAFLIGNVYTDGRLLKIILSWKKYYQMVGIAMGALFFYWLFKKNPNQASSMIGTANEYIKYMPIDNHTAGFIAPILDFTSKQNFFGDSEFLRADGNYGSKILSSSYSASANPMDKREMRVLQSGGDVDDTNSKRVKRSVSETKKKFVASRQGWKCGDCQQQLNAWFEVDHKIRLEHGGSNHVDNLLALCRECHGKKTTIENL
jgi:hypothetical protein